MIFFTSDPHFWHNNVIRYCSRPYASVEAMNEDMIKKWNSVVKPEDAVYCLGDFSLAFRAVEAYTCRLNGTKKLVPGNHDFCHSYHPKSRTPERREIWKQKYRDYGWEILPEQMTLEIAGLGIVNICHHPYAGADAREDDPSKGDKYAKWRLPDDGKILLCGHIHEKWRVRRSPKGTLMINVGVDVNNFMPISEEEIVRTARENEP